MAIVMSDIPLPLPSPYKEHLAGRIFHPTEGRRLSWPGWLVTYQFSIATHLCTKRAEHWVTLSLCRTLLPWGHICQPRNAIYRNKHRCLDGFETKDWKCWMLIVQHRNMYVLKLVRQLVCAVWLAFLHLCTAWLRATVSCIIHVCAILCFV